MKTQADIGIPMSVVTSQEPLSWETKTFFLPEETDNYELMIINVDEFEKCYRSRVSGQFLDWDASIDRNYIEAPIGVIDERGRCSVLSGQTQYERLKSAGNRLIPMALSQRSIKNAQRMKIVRKLSYPRYEKKLGGIVLFRPTNKGVKTLLLRDDAGKWSIPKGHLEKGETFIEGALRECWEETGIDVEVDLGTYLDLPTNGKLFRVYLGYTDTKEVILSHEHDKYKWFTPEEAKSKLHFPQLAHAVDVLSDSISMMMSNPDEDDEEDDEWESVILDDVYDEFPHDHEIIWNYVRPVDWASAEFPVIEIDPQEWVKTTVDSAGTTVIEAFEDHAEDWQRDLVKQYRSKAKEVATNSYIMVSTDDDAVVDGYHRLVAMALEGITRAQAVDLSDEL
jgi:8-oxo-dGTP pyrophosphatase MutT (NUDIX family)